MTLPLTLKPSPTRSEGNKEDFTLVAADVVTTGGMDWANYALAGFLARAGHAVTLVTHRADAGLLAQHGVSLHAVRKPMGSYFLGRWTIRRVGLRVGRGTAARGGRVIVNGGNCPFPDINWVHFVHAAYCPDPPASLLRRWKQRVQRPIDLGDERSALRKARVVICNSERTRRDVIDRVGVDPARAKTIYYGTDATRFHAASDSERIRLRSQLGWPADRPVVAFVGALGDRRKGFDTLFEAWSTLCKNSDWDPILVVIGRGAELPAWQARAAGLGDRVRFLGFRADVPDLLRAADALAAPARYEAYGLGVHEALCCGLPAIVSATAGVAERYPPEMADLLLPTPDDALDLANRLRRWRGDTIGTRQRIEPFAARLRSYSWDDMSVDLLKASKNAPSLFA